jgi:type IVB pilus formation R64 PilN family outer membrane protein
MILKKIIFPTIAVLLTGCINNVIPDSDSTLSFQKQRFERASQAASSFKEHKLPFVSAGTFEKPEPYPAYLNKTVFVSVQKPSSLKYFASKISSQIHKPVRISEDIYAVDSIIGGDEEEDKLDNDDDSTILVNSSNSPTEPSPLAMREVFNTSGTAVQALNEITSRFNVHWKHTDNEVLIFKLETKRMSLHLLTSESLESSFVGASTTEDNGLTTKITSKFEGADFEKYQKTLENMLSPYGKAQLLPNSGAVVVTDTPDRVSDIANFIKDENKSLTRKVALSVEVIQVQSSDDSDVGLIWQDLLANFGNVAISGSSTEPQFSQTVTGSLSTAFNGGKLTGSNLLIKALASKARVTVLTKETRMVLNNTPAPFRDVSIIEYPSETTQTVDNGVTTISSTKGTIRPGFDMNVLPRILDDNRILLNVTTTMSRALPFETITSGGSTQKFANLVQKEFKTTDIIRDGELTMLTGYINSASSASEEGTGNSGFWALGGGQSTSKSKDMLIVFVTPYLSRN